MAVPLPQPSMIEDILKSYIETTVSDILNKHVKACQDEIAEVLPSKIGVLTARVIQEYNKNSPIEPCFNINIYNKEMK